MNNFTTNSCSQCENGTDSNSCNTPSQGNYCDQSIGFVTGLTDNLNVFESDETNRTKGNLVTYTTSTNGTIYNMIPGETYYWEAADDSTVYGIVKANGYRRLIKSPVRNVRDLGGLAVDTDGDGTSDGRIKYGILFRGTQLSSNQSDATSLQKLGITRELDLRPNSEGKDKGQAVLPKYDIDTPGSEQDVIMHNYLISYSSHPDYYTELRNTIKTVMNYVVEDDDSIYFHCTIGTDRTGTLAYFLEGLLGVSEEDRLEDYELSYYFGMTNRDRYHDYLQNSSYNPRFTTMYNTYNTNAKIYEWFMNENPNITQAEKDADEILLSRFRQKMIE
jgi:protein tyrosine/serine phosphatase